MVFPERGNVMFKLSYVLQVDEQRFFRFFSHIHTLFSLSYHSIFTAHYIVLLREIVFFPDESTTIHNTVRQFYYLCNTRDSCGFSTSLSSSDVRYNDVICLCDVVKETSSFNVLSKSLQAQKILRATNDERQSHEKINQDFSSIHFSTYLSLFS